MMRLPIELPRTYLNAAWDPASMMPLPLELPGAYLNVAWGLPE
jgi:hypothetical protein